MRTRGTGAVAAALVAVFTLAACGEDAGDPGASPSPPEPGPPATGSPVPPVPPTVPPSPGLPVPIDPPGTPPSGEITLTGEVFAGVTAGCWLIATAQGDYLLLGEAARDLQADGSTVRLRGYVRDDVATICQQGTPFHVTEVLDP